MSQLFNILSVRFKWLEHRGLRCVLSKHEGCRGVFHRSKGRKFQRTLLSSTLMPTSRSGSLKRRGAPSRFTLMVTRVSGVTGEEDAMVFVIDVCSEMRRECASVSRCKADGWMISDDDGVGGGDVRAARATADWRFKSRRLTKAAFQAIQVLELSLLFSARMQASLGRSSSGSGCSGQRTVGRLCWRRMLRLREGRRKSGWQESCELK